MPHQRWFWIYSTEHTCNTWCLQINCTSLFLLSQDIESNGEQYEDNPTWAQLSRLNRRHFLKERRLTGDKLQTLATLKLIFYCRFKYQDLYFSRQHQELKKINYVFNEDIFNHFKGEALKISSWCQQCPEQRPSPVAPTPSTRRQWVWSARRRTTWTSRARRCWSSAQRRPGSRPSCSWGNQGTTTHNLDYSRLYDKSWWFQAWCYCWIQGSTKVQNIFYQIQHI